MDLGSHKDHKWKQVGRCVYCEVCNMRLYQGRLPAPGKQEEMATGLDDVLAAARAKVEKKVKKEWDERTPEQEAAYEEGKASYVIGESVMDRIRRGNPHKGTDLASWVNRGWHAAEGKYFRDEDEKRA